MRKASVEPALFDLAPSLYKTWTPAPRQLQHQTQKTESSTDLKKDTYTHLPTATDCTPLIACRLLRPYITPPSSLGKRCKLTMLRLHLSVPSFPTRYYGMPIYGRGLYFCVYLRHNSTKVKPSRVNPMLQLRPSHQPDHSTNMPILVTSTTSSQNCSHDSHRRYTGRRAAIQG